MEGAREQLVVQPRRVDSDRRLCLGCLGSLVFNLTPLLGYPNNDVARAWGFSLPDPHACSNQEN